MNIVSKKSVCFFTSVALFLLSILIMFTVNNTHASAQATANYSTGVDYYAAKATSRIIIDGVKDERYNQTMRVSFGSTKESRATISALWDENYIYVYADIYDKTPTVLPPGLLAPDAYGKWESDSLESVFDLNNHKTASSEEDDVQFVVSSCSNTWGLTKYGQGPSDYAHIIGKFVKGKDYITNITSSGYVIEYRYPLSIYVPANTTGGDFYEYTVDAKENTKIGFGFQLNCASSAGVRDSYISWGGAVNAPSAWNSLIMKNEIPEDMLPVDENEIKVKKTDDFALNKIAYMNVDSAMGCYADKGIDGDKNTFARSKNNEKWIYTVDLKYPILIGEIKIKTDKINYAQNLKIQYYNAEFESWIDLREILDNSGAEISLKFESSKVFEARLIRILSDKAIINNVKLGGSGIDTLSVYPSKNQTIFLDSFFDNSFITNIEKGEQSSANENPDDVKDREGITDKYKEAPKKSSSCDSTNLVTMMSLLLTTLVLLVISKVGR